MDRSTKQGELLSSRIIKGIQPYTSWFGVSYGKMFFGASAECTGHNDIPLFHPNFRICTPSSTCIIDHAQHSQPCLDHDLSLGKYRTPYRSRVSLLCMFLRNPCSFMLLARLGLRSSALAPLAGSLWRSVFRATLP